MGTCLLKMDRAGNGTVVFENMTFQKTTVKSGLISTGILSEMWDTLCFKFNLPN
jgi:hypothetical protein